MDEEGADGRRSSSPHRIAYHDALIAWREQLGTIGIIRFKPIKNSRWSSEAVIRQKSVYGMSEKATTNSRGSSRHRSCVTNSRKGTVHRNWPRIFKMCLQDEVSK
ncbi:hypothetical protein ACI65C_004139 [Semiaphis heraclei]